MWASSGFPFPPRGFENRTLHENFDYLLNIGKDRRVPKEVSRMFPWVLWMLWRNKNVFRFEGKEYEPGETVTKCREEARRWFDANEASR